MNSIPKDILVVIVKFLDFKDVLSFLKLNKEFYEKNYELLSYIKPLKRENIPTRFLSRKFKNLIVPALKLQILERYMINKEYYDSFVENSCFDISFDRNYIPIDCENLIIENSYIQKIHLNYDVILKNVPKKITLSRIKSNVVNTANLELDIKLPHGIKIIKTAYFINHIPETVSKLEFEMHHNYEYSHYIHTIWYVERDVKFEIMFDTIDISNITSLSFNETKPSALMEFLHKFKYLNSLKVKFENEDSSGDLKIGGKYAYHLKFPPHLKNLEIHNMYNHLIINMPRKLESFHLETEYSTFEISKFSQKLKHFILKSHGLPHGKSIVLPDSLKSAKIDYFRTNSGFRSVDILFVFPDNLESLNIVECCAIEIQSFPKNLKHLNIKIIDIKKWHKEILEFPKNLESLILDGYRYYDLPEFPKNLKFLSLKGIRTFLGMKLPKSIQTVITDELNNYKIFKENIEKEFPKSKLIDIETWDDNYNKSYVLNLIKNNSSRKRKFGE